MSVSVVNPTNGVVTTYEDAEKYHVDDERQLHIIGAEGKRLAAWATGAWQSVRVDTA